MEKPQRIARKTTFEWEPGRYRDGIAAFTQAVERQLRVQTGYQGGVLTANKDGTVGTTTCYWGDFPSLNASAEVEQEMRRNVARKSGALVTNVDIFLVYRSVPFGRPQNFAATRRSNFYTSPEKLPDTLGVFDKKVVPIMARQPDLRGIMFTASPVTGQVSIVATWESEAGRTAGTAAEAEAVGLLTIAAGTPKAANELVAIGYSDTLVIGKRIEPALHARG